MLRVFSKSTISNAYNLLDDNAFLWACIQVSSLDMTSCINIWDFKLANTLCVANCCYATIKMCAIFYLKESTKLTWSGYDSQFSYQYIWSGCKLIFTLFFIIFFPSVKEPGKEEDGCFHTSSKVQTSVSSFWMTEVQINDPLWCHQKLKPHNELI